MDPLTCVKKRTKIKSLVINLLEKNPPFSHFLSLIHLKQMLNNVIYANKFKKNNNVQNTFTIFKLERNGNYVYNHKNNR